MADLATLRVQLDELRAARVSGVSKVVFRDRETWFKSDADMAAAIRDLEAQIALAEGRPAVRFHTITKDRGWS
jgi:hypothetical protein